MVLQAVDRWPPAAIHDTVAALLRDRAYHRSVMTSLVGKLLALLWKAIGALIEVVRGIPGGRNTVIAILSVVLLLLIVRVLMTGSWRDVGLQPRRGSRGRVLRADPWSDAEALAAAGDYLGAAHALYQAVLRGIAATERIRLHASKTSGDYARELRRRESPLTAPFQVFGRRFDRVVFGAGECSADEFAAMLRDASTIRDGQAA